MTLECGRPFGELSNTCWCSGCDGGRCNSAGNKSGCNDDEDDDEDDVDIGTQCPIKKNHFLIP